MLLMESWIPIFIATSVLLVLAIIWLYKYSIIDRNKLSIVEASLLISIAFFIGMAFNTISQNVNRINKLENRIDNIAREVYEQSTDK